MAASNAPKSVFDGESFISEYYGAWSGMDEDRILSYYADNVVLQIPGTLMEGKEALRDQFVRPFITAFPGNRHLSKTSVAIPISLEGTRTNEFQELTKAALQRGSRQERRRWIWLDWLENSTNTGQSKAVAHEAS
jgi:hypothetical protein